MIYLAAVAAAHLATPSARNPLGRFEVTRATTEADLRRLLRVGRR